MSTQDLRQTKTSSARSFGIPPYFDWPFVSRILPAEDDATMATEDDMARLKQLEEKMDGLGIQFEKVREDIKKLGEGYEDGMRRVSEEIKDMGRHWDHKWSPHDLAIRNHDKRIRVLERRRPRPSSR